MEELTAMEKNGEIPVSQQMSVKTHLKLLNLGVNNIHTNELLSKVRSKTCNDLSPISLKQFNSVTKYISCINNTIPEKDYQHNKSKKRAKLLPEIMERYELNCDEPTNPNQPKKRKINKNPPKIIRKRKGGMGETAFPHSKYSIEKNITKKN